MSNDELLDLVRDEYESNHLPCEGLKELLLIVHPMNMKRNHVNMNIMWMHSIFPEF